MSVQLGTTSITFNDATTQSTASGTPPGNGQCITTYTGPATWTKPATCKGIKVTVIGAGGNSQDAPYTGNQVKTTGGGGGGGASVGWFPGPNIPGPIAVTVGAAGSQSPSSFGSLISATAGAPGAGASAGTSGGGSAGSGAGGQFTFAGNPGGNSPGSGAGSGGYMRLFPGADNYSGNFGGSSNLNNGAYPGTANPYYGGGASGAAQVNNGGAGTAFGATGGPGWVLVEEHY